MSVFYASHNEETNAWQLRNNLTGEAYTFDDEDVFITCEDGERINLGYSTEARALAAIERHSTDSSI